ncbi:MAG: hypothetical protein PQJ44_03055 [Sphaerochaetaceae bacterium]|nr:hypothetical protein [Sphaerochaetaceae bacterium]
MKTPKFKKTTNFIFFFSFCHCHKKKEKSLAGKNAHALLPFLYSSIRVMSLIATKDNPPDEESQEKVFTPPLALPFRQAAAQILKDSSIKEQG